MNWEQIDILKIQNGWQLLAYITIIFVSVGLPIIIEQRKNKRNILEKQEETKKILIEEKKDIQEKIGIIEKKLTFLYDNTKDIVLVREITRNITTLCEKIIETKEVQEKEVSDIIRKASDEIISIMKTIIYSNYILSEKELKEMIFFHFRKIKNENLNNYENKIIKEVSYKIKAEIDNFLFLYNEIAKLENGERREKFSKSAIIFTKNVLNNSIDMYNYMI